MWYRIHVSVCYSDRYTDGKMTQEHGRQPERLEADEENLTAHCWLWTTLIKGQFLIMSQGHNDTTWMNACNTIFLNFILKLWSCKYLSQLIDKGVNFHLSWFFNFPLNRTNYNIFPVNPWVNFSYYIITIWR